MHSEAPDGFDFDARRYCEDCEGWTPHEAEEDGSFSCMSCGGRAER